MSFLAAVATALSLITLEGTARRADGTPEAGALVCALPDAITDDIKAPSACASADPSGAFRLQVPAGTYMVSATSPGSAGALARKVEAGTPVALVLPEGGRTVSGRVRDARGKAVPKAWVFAVRKSGTEPEVLTAAADGKGRFSFSLAAEPFLLAATSGELESELASVEGSGPADVDLQLRPVAKGPAPAEVTAWIRKAAIPLTTVTAGNGFTDMEPLAAVVGDARVVALGEATHGTKEFFQLKHRMLEFLVRKMGFTTFAIEASLPDALAVDAYVVDGIGDPAAALNGLRFWTWNTEEVLALIRWMREYNQDPANVRKLHFVGMDMQAPSSTADRLAQYLKQVAPDEDTRRLLDPLEPLTAWQGQGKPDPGEQAAVAATIAALDAYLREHEAAFRAASGPSPYTLALRLAELLRQAQDVFWGSAFGARDRAMADNTRWWLERDPGTRMVLWAHNGHVSMDDRVGAGEPMGRHLRRALGPAYLVFGFAFDRGAFQAIETGKGLHPMSVGAAKVESLDAALASAGMGILALDLRRIPARGSVADWFDIPRPARSVGALFDPEHEDAYYAVQRAPRVYDALLFVEATSSAVPVKPARRASGPPRTYPETATNLDFEAEPVEGEPPGWIFPTKAGGYRVLVEGNACAEGTRCARLDREGERGKSMPFGNVMQSVSAVPYRGKKVRFRASVRAEEGQAQLWLRVDRQGDERGFFDNMHDRPIRDTAWKPYEIVGEVADDAVSLNFGMMLIGSGGRAWIDGVSLEVVQPAP